ncbi:MAG: TetR/AcrR family transcriptional regulator [Jiangellaceae bacterium]
MENEEPIGLQSGSSTGPGGPCLPVLDVGVVRERADAARNRRKVLTAAEALFARRGVGVVTMDDVARAAGVGKGTLYRRFGDKSGLAEALLDERERELQQGLLEGPPPLGPGADPVQRLVAFAGSYLRYVVTHLDVVLMSETSTPGARLRTGANRLWRLHCARLLEAAGADDPGLRADALLAALSAEQVQHWLHVHAGHEGTGREPPEGIVDGLSRLCEALARP